MQRFLLVQLLPHISPLKVGDLSVLSAMGPWALFLAEHCSYIQDFLLDLGLGACHGPGPDWNNDSDESSGLWGPAPLAFELSYLHSAPFHLFSHLLFPDTVFVNPQVSKSIILDWEGLDSVHRRLGELLFKDLSPIL